MTGEDNISRDSSSPFIQWSEIQTVRDEEGEFSSRFAKITGKNGQEYQVTLEEDTPELLRELTKKVTNEVMGHFKTIAEGFNIGQSDIKSVEYAPPKAPEEGIIVTKNQNKETINEYHLSHITEPVKSYTASINEVLTAAKKVDQLFITAQKVDRVFTAAMPPPQPPPVGPLRPSTPSLTKPSSPANPISESGNQSLTASVAAGAAPVAVAVSAGAGPAAATSVASPVPNPGVQVVPTSTAPIASAASAVASSPVTNSPTTRVDKDGTTVVIVPRPTAPASVSVTPQLSVIPATSAIPSAAIAPAAAATVPTPPAQQPAPPAKDASTVSAQSGSATVQSSAEASAIATPAAAGAGTAPPIPVRTSDSEGSTTPLSIQPLTTSSHQSKGVAARTEQLAVAVGVARPDGSRKPLTGATPTPLATALGMSGGLPKLRPTATRSPVSPKAETTNAVPAGSAATPAAGSASVPASASPVASTTAPASSVTPVTPAAGAAATVGSTAGSVAAPAAAATAATVPASATSASTGVAKKASTGASARDPMRDLNITSAAGKQPKTITGEKARIVKHREYAERPPEEVNVKFQEAVFMEQKIKRLQENIKVMQAQAGFKKNPVYFSLIIQAQDLLKKIKSTIDEDEELLKKQRSFIINYETQAKEINELAQDSELLSGLEQEEAIDKKDQNQLAGRQARMVQRDIAKYFLSKNEGNEDLRLKTKIHEILLALSHDPGIWGSFLNQNKDPHLAFMLGMFCAEILVRKNLIKINLQIVKEQAVLLNKTSDLGSEDLLEIQRNIQSGTSPSDDKLSPIEKLAKNYLRKSGRVRFLTKQYNWLEKMSLKQPIIPAQAVSENDTLRKNYETLQLVCQELVHTESLFLTQLTQYEKFLTELKEIEILSEEEYAILSPLELLNIVKRISDEGMQKKDIKNANILQYVLEIFSPENLKKYCIATAKALVNKEAGNDIMVRLEGKIREDKVVKEKIKAKYQAYLELQRKYLTQFDIGAYQILATQRFPRFGLLLQEILKQVSKPKVDLEEKTKQVKEVSEQLERAVSDEEKSRLGKDKLRLMEELEQLKEKLSPIINEREPWRIATRHNLDMATSLGQILNTLKAASEF